MLRPQRRLADRADAYARKRARVLAEQYEAGDPTAITWAMRTGFIDGYKARQRDESRGSK